MFAFIFMKMSGFNLDHKMNIMQNCQAIIFIYEFLGKIGEARHPRAEAQLALEIFCTKDDIFRFEARVAVPEQLIYFVSLER